MESQNFAELIQNGWIYHETESDRLAAELENTSCKGLTVAQISQCLQLSNHTIGEHLGDWLRARKFIQSVLEANPSSSKDSSIACHRYVAEYMSGNQNASLRVELDALSSADPVLGTYIALKSMLAAALVGSGSWDKGFEILNALNETATKHEIPNSTIRTLAITNNNVANEFLSTYSPNERQREALLECAESALVFWKMCGTWLNEERALYLLSLAHANTGDLNQSLDHAQAALRVIQSNGEEPVDEAFIRLAAAKAYLGMDDLENARNELEHSDKIAEAWSDEAIKEEYQSLRSKLAFV